MQPVSLPLTAPVCLDLTNECLRYGAQTIFLRPKTFAVLRCLVEHADQLVSKTALLEAVWPKTVVSDGVLMVCIRELRQALGDDPRTSQFIATAHRRGYRFIGQITREPASAEAACLWLTPRGGLPAPARPPTPPAKAVHLQQTFSQNAVAGRLGETMAASEQARPVETPIETPAPVWEQKPVVVLVIALTFPTPGNLATLSYEPRNVARRWQQCLAEQVQRFGGLLLPGVPSLYIAAFGLPLTLDQMPQRAVQAALAIRSQVMEATRTSGVELRPEVRLAVHVGEILADVSAATLAQVRVVGAGHFDAGMHGEPLREGEDYGSKAAEPVGEVLALGETLALAVQLLGAAAPGDILVSSQVGRTVEGQYTLKARVLPVGARLRKRIGAYAVIGLKARGVPLVMSGGRLLSPFVGRERELAVLDEWLVQAMHGRGQVVGLVGEPGVGKSRLVAEFKARHVRRIPPAQQRVMVLEGGCVAYGSIIPYLPVRALLRTCLHLTEHTDSETLGIRLAAALQVLDAALVPSLPALLALLDVPNDDPEWQALDPPQRRQRTLDAVKHLLLRASQRQPLLVIIEDVHWLDGETQALLDCLVDSLSTARLFLLVSYRPEYHHGWGSKTSYTQLRLDPLPLTSTEDLLQALLGEDAGLVPVKRQLIARTGGNPFFLEESLQTLVETGVLVGEAGAYYLVQALPTLQVPATVHAVLAARIDRLSPEDKHLLQTAAVIGTAVPLTLLQAIAARPEAVLSMSLARLQEAEFLYETTLLPAREYTFKHALTHEVAYRSLLQERRRALHARIVAALELLAGGRGAEAAPGAKALPAGRQDPDQVERLAYHARWGELWDKALTYCRQAGEKAMARPAYREAVGYFEQALSALSHLPEQRTTCEQAIDLRLALRSALAPLGHFGRILTLLREAEALAAALDDPWRLGRVSRFLIRQFYFGSAHDQAIAAAQRALALASAGGDAVLQALANQSLGDVYEAQGDFRRAIDCFAQTMAFVDGVRDHERFGEILFPAANTPAKLARCHAELGTFAEGRAVGDAGLRLAEAVAHPPSLMHALQGLALLALRQGDLPRALPLLERAVRLCQEANLPTNFPWMAETLGAAYTLVGRIADAVPLLTHALAQSAATEMVVTQTPCRLSLGEAQLLAGCLEEAQALAEQALMHARGHQERGHQAYALRLLGDIAARRKPAEGEAAETSYQQALALADELGMRPLQAHCHRDLGTLYATTGQREQARAQLAAAITMYRDMDMTFWLPETEAALVQVDA